MLAHAILSPEKGDIVASGSPGQQAREQYERNIQRAMDGTATSQDEVPDQVLDGIGSGGMPLEWSVQELLEE
ncbi:hypothetical protein C487_02398 [Natrinema pallidum DSM 3751]|uniref:Uncharacterized protein n=1 Tax=Natrinema pallidum DSM 3751 TaxID=1227495 RepID=L9ZAQ4_9EURY|nr:hypothetical protein C487_02398 [Natrinema pallidum DSM 3751]